MKTIEKLIKWCRDMTNTSSSGKTARHKVAPLAVPSEPPVKYKGVYEGGDKVKRNISEVLVVLGLEPRYSVEEVLEMDHMQARLLDTDPDKSRQMLHDMTLIEMVGARLLDLDTINALPWRMTGLLMVRQFTRDELEKIRGNIDWDYAARYQKDIDQNVLATLAVGKIDQKWLDFNKHCTDDTKTKYARTRLLVERLTSL